MRRLVGLLFVASLLAGCAGLNGGATGNVYEVQRGDTLYSIAWRHGVDYRTLARINHIEPPYVIKPGQRLRVSTPRPALAERASGEAPTPLVSNGGRGAPPRAIASLPPRDPSPLGRPFGGSVAASQAGDDSPRESSPPPRAEPARQQPSPPPRPAPPAATASRPQAQPAPRPPSPPQRPGAASIVWQWPSDGPVLKAFSASGDGKQGINLGGEVGQPVRAAAPGRVVYSGNGLLGYGNLVIVKHDGSYLTAYGYNSQLLVSEGETVTAGQRIATMGTGSGSRAALHFELRRDGKPVDPLSLLPPR